MIDVLLLDGGLSTQLERMGVDISGPLWTARSLLENPEILLAAHRAYVDAGADIVTTASYQVSSIGLGANAEAALRASVEIARESGAGIIAASIGPYGAVLHDGSEYRGNYDLSRAQLASFHAERIAVIVDAGADCLAFETIPDATEVAAIVDAVGELEIPLWLSFSVRDAGHLADGTPLAEAVETALRMPSLIALGVNCLPAADVPAALNEIARNCDHPLVAYPNGGGAWNAATGSWDDMTGVASADDVLGWVDQGATIVGGCCGTDASVIASYAAVMR